MTVSWNTYTWEVFVPEKQLQNFPLPLRIKKKWKSHGFAGVLLQIQSWALSYLSQPIGMDRASNSSSFTVHLGQAFPGNHKIEGIANRDGTACWKRLHQHNLNFQSKHQLNVSQAPGKEATKRIRHNPPLGAWGCPRRHTITIQQDRVVMARHRKLWMQWRESGHMPQQVSSRRFYLSWGLKEEYELTKRKRRGKGIMKSRKGVMYLLNTIRSSAWWIFYL